MVDKWGAAADVHAGVEDLHRRLEALGPAKTEDEKNLRWFAEQTLMEIKCGVRAELPDYEKMRGLLNNARKDWQRICLVVNIVPALKFLTGRKPGTGGPIRKAIARLLKKNPDPKPRELWAALKNNPPRGWSFCDNLQGKYIEGPRANTGMSYARFCNIASEERGKAKR